MDWENIYTAVANAETGGESNPWIRTRVIPEKGSTAFGPVQITGDLVRDALNRNKLSPESALFALETMIPMQELFAKYGAKDMVPGKEIYDYGQTGGFNPDMYSDDYKKLAIELMQMKNRGASGRGAFNKNAFLEAWRGDRPEEGYEGRFNKKYKNRSHYSRD